MRNAGLIALMAGLGLPAIALRLSGTHLGTVGDTAIYGLAIVTAAFLLAWAAEAAEVDISQGLAIAIVALIAVLPEYAVGMTFAWKAGTDPQYEALVVANMTGANRLLIGAAWPLLFLIFWWRIRKPVLELEHGHAVEVLALAVATLYSFSLPLKGSITLVDTVVLAALFVAYVWVISRQHTEAPELIGPARSIGELPAIQRRGSIFGLFAFAAFAIFASAEPFAEGLVHSGVQLGIDEFLLVQWLAPFASEAPEFLFAGILAWRGRAGVGMGALLSSKVNQWTLLIGGLPVAYALSKGEVVGLPLDDRQVEEVLLTAAQSAFAVAILVSLSLSKWEAALLFVLFAVTFVIPSEQIRLVISAVYVVLAIAIAIHQHADVRRLLVLSRAAMRAQPPAEPAEVRR